MLKKDNKKLFSVVGSDAKANELKQKLASNGYAVSVEQNGNLFNVFYSSQTPKIKVTAGVMNCFSQIGENAYKALQKLAGIYDYDFDDGSVWRIEKFEDGEYLVKEINGDNENDVVRVKTASSDSKGLDEETFRKIMTMFYGNNLTEVIDDAIENESLRREFESVLSKKLDNAITSCLKKHKFIVSEKLVNDLHTSALNNKTVRSRMDLEDFVRIESAKYVKENA